MFSKLANTLLNARVVQEQIRSAVLDWGEPFFQLLTDRYNGLVDGLADLPDEVDRFSDRFTALERRFDSIQDRLTALERMVRRPSSEMTSEQWEDFAQAVRQVVDG